MKVQRWLSGLGCMVAAATASQSAAEALPAPVSAFLRAADAGDKAAMGGLLASDVQKQGGGTVSPAKFVDSLAGCYLRRVYTDASAPSEAMAAWMCTRNKGRIKSAVLIARVAVGPNGTRLYDYSVRESAMAAPPRKGSAFAGE